MPHLLNALDDTFGYHVYRDEAVSQAETDDLATRRAETLQAERLYGYRDQLRAAARYATWAASVGAGSCTPAHLGDREGTGDRNPAGDAGQVDRPCPSIGTPSTGCGPDSPGCRS